MGRQAGRLSLLGATPRCFEVLESWDKQLGCKGQADGALAEPVAPNA